MTIEAATTQPDWATDKAEDMLNLVLQAERDTAIKLIAAGLRVAHQEGQREGLKTAERMVDGIFKAHGYAK